MGLVFADQLGWCQGGQTLGRQNLEVPSVVYGLAGYSYRGSMYRRPLDALLGFMPEEHHAHAGA